METSPVAWYAAILSTIVLTWDLAKWWRAEPRLKISARPDVTYMDSKVVDEEQHPDGTMTATLASYCHVEIVNTGGRPTTLISVDAISRRKHPPRAEMSVGTKSFTVHRGSDQLPVKLGPGEMWSARVDMRQLHGLEQFGPVHIRARAAYRRDPIESRVIARRL